MSRRHDRRMVLIFQRRASEIDEFDRARNRHLDCARTRRRRRCRHRRRRRHIRRVVVGVVYITTDDSHVPGSFQ